MRLKPSDAIALQKKMGLDVGRDLRRPKRSREDKAAAALFAAMCFAHGIPAPQPEYRFHPERKWRFDWAWPAADGPVGRICKPNIAVEIEGGAYSSGRHTRGKGFIEDMVKYNEAVLLGWRLLRFTPQQIQDGSAFPVIRRALES